MPKHRVPAGDKRIVNGGAGKRESRVRSEPVSPERLARRVGFDGVPDPAAALVRWRRGDKRPRAVKRISCIDSGKVIGLTPR
jgi:hypothetical protein